MAPDAFVAAGIADAPMTKTTLTACRIALIIFLGGGLLIYPGWITDLVGTIIVVALLGIRAPGLLRSFKSQGSAPVPGGK